MHSTAPTLAAASWRIVHCGQLVAHAAADPVRLDLAAGSFRDLTRVALSDERMWVELLDANGAMVAEHLRSLGARLEAFATLVESGDTDGIRDEL